MRLGLKYPDLFSSIVAVLDEMKIPHDYWEFDGIAHNLVNRRLPRATRALASNTIAVRGNPWQPGFSTISV